MSKQSGNSLVGDNDGDDEELSIDEQIELETERGDRKYHEERDER